MQLASVAGSFEYKPARGAGSQEERQTAGSSETRLHHHEARVAIHRASRATCAARLSKSISAPAAGNGCGSTYANQPAFESKPSFGWRVGRAPRETCHAGGRSDPWDAG